MNNNYESRAATTGRGIAVFSDKTLTPSRMIYRATSAPAYVSPYTYTADSDCYVVMWVNYNGTDLGAEAFETLKIQAELGSIATAYEP